MTKQRDSSGSGSDKEKELSLASMAAYLANAKPGKLEECQVCPAFEKEKLKHLLKPGFHVIISHLGDRFLTWPCHD